MTSRRHPVTLAGRCVVGQLPRQWHKHKPKHKPKPPKPKSPADALTKREREVLQLVGEGQSTPEIAAHLGLSVKTIEGHRSRIMAKLECKNVAGMTRWAIKLGLVSVNE